MNEINEEFVSRREWETMERLQRSEGRGTKGKKAMQEK